MKNTVLGMTALALIMFCGSVVFAQEPVPVGGYSKAPTDDKQVVAAANFAVQEMNKNKNIPPTTLVSIKRAEKQVVSGMNYRFCLEIKSGTEPQTVEAIIYQNLKKKLTLTDWEAKQCGEEEKNNDESAEPKTGNNPQKP